LVTPIADAAHVNGNIVFTVLIGCMGGAAMSTLIADSLGRTRSMLVDTLLFVLGGIIQAA
jgi:RNase adaptor protein for sRNA GlmZ degradation